MDYLDYFNRQELINERARCSSELNQLKVKKEDDESVKEITQENNNNIIKTHEQEGSEDENTNNQETRTTRVTGRNPDYAYRFSSWMNDSDERNRTGQ